jgi:hypothetical protein
VLVAGFIFAGDYRWVAGLCVGLLLLIVSLERCPSCGGALMIFKHKRLGADGPLVCKACWDEGGERPAGPADPMPPRR